MERTITLTQSQLRKYQVIERYRSKAITRAKAAEMLGLSERQVSRLKKGIEAEGAEFVINKNTGKTPAHAITAETKERIISIYGEAAFQRANFLHFREILESDYKIVISYTHSGTSSKVPGSKVQRASGKENVERNVEIVGITQVSWCRSMPPPLNGLGD